MQSQCNTVDEYMLSLEENRRQALSIVRQLILENAPNAKELMNYGMPAYELNGMLCAFASQKNYMSLYMLNTPVLEKYKAKLGKLSVGKGCIRFKKIEDLPLDIIKEVIIESVIANQNNFNDHC